MQNNNEEKFNMTKDDLEEGCYDLKRVWPITAGTAKIKFSYWKNKENTMMVKITIIREGHQTIEEILTKEDASEIAGTIKSCLCHVAAEQQEYIEKQTDKVKKSNKKRKLPVKRSTK